MSGKPFDRLEHALTSLYNTQLDQANTDTLHTLSNALAATSNARAATSNARAATSNASLKNIVAAAADFAAFKSAINSSF
jgi:hypothetical protein